MFARFPRLRKACHHPPRLRRGQARDVRPPTSASLVVLLAELDRLAAGGSAGAAQVAAEVRRGHLAYWLGVMAATAVEGDSAFVVMDPVLAALARYEMVTTGRDYMHLPPVPIRRRVLQAELLAEASVPVLFGEHQLLAIRCAQYRGSKPLIP